MPSEKGKAVTNLVPPDGLPLRNGTQDSIYSGDQCVADCVEEPWRSYIIAAANAAPGLEAEVDRLRELVESAYSEGFADAKNQSGDYELGDPNWERSEARAVLAKERGL